MEAIFLIVSGMHWNIENNLVVEGDLMKSKIVFLEKMMRIDFTIQ